MDDDESVLDMVRAVLSADGYSVQVAPDGAAALALVEARPPAVVVLDMRLPRVDGWEFARRLRERGLRVPIVAMTAGGDAPEAAREIEANEFLAKPFEIDELLTKVSRFRNQPPNN
ncbi:MAG: response regulator [Chloroflexota bacterium]|nr:response regulator [Chloroflexota bacterium]